MKELGLEPKGFAAKAKQTVTLFLALVLVSLALSLALAFLHLNDLDKVAVEVERVERATPWFLYYLLSVRVVAEEVFFRGFLAKKFGSLASSGVFALAHVFYGSLAEVVGAFALGVVLARAYDANKSLYPNIFAHVGYNLIILKALFWF